MEIRLANQQDINEINNLLCLSKAYWGYDPEFMDKFMIEFSIKEAYLAKATTYKVLEEGKLIGFYSFSGNTNDNLELDNFFLHPDFIGKGKGKAMWQRCLQTASQYGATEFIVWSEIHAEGFYLRMGCQKMGKRLSIMMPNRYPPVLKYIINDEATC